MYYTIVALLKYIFNIDIYSSNSSQNIGVIDIYPRRGMFSRFEVDVMKFKLHFYIFTI